MKSKFCTKGVVAFVLLFTLVLSFIGFVPMRRSALAESIVSPQDEAAIKGLLLQLAEDEGYNTANFEYEPFDVYYPDETWAGCDIEFSIEDTIGYGIFFKVNGMMTMVEISFESHSPYFGKDGMYIYPKIDTYYIKTAEGYFDAKTDKLLIDYDPSDYVGAKSSGSNGEKTSKSYNYYFGGLATYEIPNFCSYSNYTKNENSCANVAGTIMLNYWNKLYDNDIVKETDLDYQGNFTYDAAEKYEYIFHTYMNTGIFGTSPDNCAKGFKMLITGQNYNCDIIDLKDSTYENAIGWLKQNIPFFITAENYYFTSGNSKYIENIEMKQTGRDPQVLRIEYEYFEGISKRHAFVAIGYGYYYMTNIVNSSYIRYNINFYRVLDGWGNARYFNADENNTLAIQAIKVTK